MGIPMSGFISVNLGCDGLYVFSQYFRVLRQKKKKKKSIAPGMPLTNLLLYYCSILYFRLLDLGACFPLLFSSPQVVLS